MEQARCLVESVVLLFPFRKDGLVWAAFGSPVPQEVYDGREKSS